MKKFRNSQLAWVLKVVVATAIFYLWISVYIDRTGDVLNLEEEIDTFITQKKEVQLASLSGVSFTGTVLEERAEELMQLALEEIYSSTHSVASDTSYKRLFQEMCIGHIFTCVKVDFDGVFSWRERFLYFSSVAHVTSFFDRNLRGGASMSRALDTIVLTKDDGKRRGYTSKNKVVISVNLIDSFEEFEGIVTHELFHVFDLMILQGRSKHKDPVYTEFGKAVFAVDDPSLDFYKLCFDSEYKRSVNAKEADFPTRYGQQDPFEFFAEAGNMYVNHHALFKYMAQYNDVIKEQYNFLSYYFEWAYLSSNYEDLRLVQGSSSYRVWDSTVIGE